MTTKRSSEDSAGENGSLPGSSASGPNTSSKKSRATDTIIGISRSISACQRCRAKKVRCDQNFPRCNKCAKAGVDCIGLDPATGREVPRSYVVHLEDKVSSLEALLKQHGIDTAMLGDGERGILKGNGISGNTGSDSIIKEEPSEMGVILEDQVASSHPHALLHHGGAPLPEYKQDMHNLVEDATNGAVLGGSKAPPGYLDQESEGISFAKLMFTAVKVNKRLTLQTSSQAPTQAQAQFQHQQPQALPRIPQAQQKLAQSDPLAASGTSPIVPPLPPIDPSVYLKHDVLPAILPPKSTAQEFLKIYFAQSNPQLPVLHREEFIKDCFVPIYGPLDPGISLASNYTAINKSIVITPADSRNHTLPEMEPTWFSQYKREFSKYISHPHQHQKDVDPVKISNSINPPAKYHKALYFLNIVFAIASSVHHLQYPATISDSFKAAAVKYIEPVYSLQNQLESLQGILLLALYSIMRPAVPGVWYVLGLALRVSVDLGLYKESGNNRDLDSFTKDKRRRLFWCTYALDRQICFYLGRPFGIPEECIQVPFPSELDDTLITPMDTSNPDYLVNVSGMPTYKVVSLSFFRIRQIQAEVQSILYFENLDLPRKYQNYEEWETDISERLKVWKNQAPKTQRKMNCDFNLVFFTLNYNHTLIMLHGISKRKFQLLVNDFHKVSEASKELINCYYQLFFSKSINYTWAAVHNLFMAGSLYLYTIYNSPQVRERNSFFEVKKVTQECITVLSSLIDRCDAASNCKDIFEVLTAAIVKIRYQETVLGVSGVVVPSTVQIARLQPAGHVNSNLEQLVDSINSSSSFVSDRSRTPETQLLPVHNHASATGFHLNPFQTTPPSSRNISDDHSPNDASPYVTVGETFEWKTNNGEDAEEVEFNQGTRDALRKTHQYDLDVFFDELENLSPASSSMHSNITPIKDYSVIDEQQRFYKQQNLNISSTPNSNTNSNSDESPAAAEKLRKSSSSADGATFGGYPAATVQHMEQSVPTREAKKIYELIHQMPTESIWDQFFATNNTYNIGFP